MARSGVMRSGGAAVRGCGGTGSAGAKGTSSGCLSPASGLLVVCVVVCASSTLCTAASTPVNRPQSHVSSCNLLRTDLNQAPALFWRRRQPWGGSVDHILQILPRGGVVNQLDRQVACLMTGVRTSHQVASETSAKYSGCAHRVASLHMSNVHYIPATGTTQYHPLHPRR